jgi:hypothetical protein
MYFGASEYKQCIELSTIENNHYTLYKLNKNTFEEKKMLLHKHFKYILQNNNKAQRKLLIFDDYWCALNSKHFLLTAAVCIFFSKDLLV